jgi:hypothetical protein
MAQQPGEPEVILHFSLSLNEQKWSTDLEAIAAIGDHGLEGFTHLWLSVPSWQQYPKATQDARVRAVVQLAERENVALIWGRMLWPPYGPEKTAWDHIRPAFYSAAITALRIEGALIGAEATALDGEPYGDSPQHALKGPDVPSLWQGRYILWAIAEAVKSVGRVDYFYPHGGYPYTFYLPDLAKHRMSMSGTWYSHPPDWKEYKREPPEGSGAEYRIDLWGIYPRPFPTGDPRHAVGSSGNVTTLSVAEARQTVTDGWPVLRKRHPTLRGFWVYVRLPDMDDFLEQWAAGL